VAFDIDTPSPDDGHEAIRVAIVQAINDLSDTSAGVDDAYWITDLLLGMADGLYTAVSDLTARVDALEAAAPSLNQPPEVAP
jgi:hypothetical protein